MDLVFRPVREGTEDLAFVKDLYIFSFPEGERVPFDEIMRVSSSDFGSIEVVLDGGKRVAMVYLLVQEGLVYIYYLAVDPGMRGRGYGSGIISCLKERFPGHRFALSTEAPDAEAANYEERIDRMEFYKRNGFLDTGRRDMWKGERYALMTYGGKVGKMETRRMFCMASVLGRAR